MAKELEIFTEQELNPDAPCMFDSGMVCPYYWTHIPLPCTGCQAYEKEHPKKIIGNMFGT